MANQRVAGLIQFQIDGEVKDAKGNFTYNLGRPMREAVLGSDGAHGYKETPQVAFIEGAITDKGNLDHSALVSITSATITLALGNGKTIMLSDAWFSGEGSGSSEEAEVAVRFEGIRGEEV